MKVTPERASITRNTTLPCGPPGIRTPNLRIKSLVRTCRSERCVWPGLRVCVSVLPIVSCCFPFLHGDETGMPRPSALSFDPSAPMSGQIPSLAVCASVCRILVNAWTSGLRTLPGAPDALPVWVDAGGELVVAGELDMPRWPNGGVAAKVRFT
jgi:hypothetical protein